MIYRGGGGGGECFTLSAVACVRKVQSQELNSLITFLHEFAML